MTPRQPVAIVLVVLCIMFSIAVIPSTAADPVCRTTNFSGYSTTLCFTSPADEAVVSGDVQITVTSTVTGSPPPLDDLVFTLNGDYLLTDYKPHYSLSLPTAHYADGDYDLRVRERYTNDDSTEETLLNLTFQNGNVTKPVNPRIFKPHVPTGSPVLIASVGDSASGERPLVTDRVRTWNADMVMYLGDVYGRGTYTEFHNYYTPHLGQLRDITNPLVGNHEYDEDGTAASYFFYWDNVPHYYSFNTGGWHVIILDSNSEFDQVEPGTPQYEWLENELLSSTSACTLVALHHPPLDVGREGINTSVGEHFWPLFVQHHVDVVTVGHAHQYQRWHPVDAVGNITQQGPVLIVNGTGGHHVDPFEESDARIAVGLDQEPEAFGAMKLKLFPNRMRFKFINESGAILDDGKVTCHSPAAPTPPVLVSPLADAIVADSSPVFVWSENPSAENVASYKLIVKSSAGTKVFVQNVSPAACSGACSVDLGTAGKNLNNKTYTWYVQAKNDGGKTKSEKRKITIAAP